MINVILHMIIVQGILDIWMLVMIIHLYEWKRKQICPPSQ